MRFTTRLVRRFGVAALTLGFVAGVMAAPAAARTPAKDGVDCTDYGKVLDAPKGYIPRDDHQIVRQDPLAKALANHRKQGEVSAALAETVTIPVKFHVIYKDEGLGGGKNGGGYLSDERIQAQIDVLNAAFLSSGFQFDFDVETDVTRTNQAEWFNLVSSGSDQRYFRGSNKEIKMKQALHEGDSETLNIYSASLGQFLLGWAWLPWDLDPEFTDGNPLPSFLDGVVLDFRSLPVVPNDTGDDSKFAIYSEGDTGTHEVGHWLGLYHTFQGGCSEPGDHVDDTAAEASPAFNCPVGRDTCVDAGVDPGVDPIRNFMDYTQDSCMNMFTAGQAVRMQASWAEFRAVD
jgi:Pregnancy-associated plasma protein-A